MLFFGVLVIIIAIAFVIVTVQNPDPIHMEFASWQFDESLAIILAIFFGIGILAGIFLMIPSWWKRVKQSRARNKHIHELEAEIAAASTAAQEEPVDAEIDPEKEPEKTDEEKKVEEEKKSEF